MALSFPPNLDDGEHWLPSDIRFELELSQTQAPHHRGQFANHSGSFGGPRDINLLASQLAALDLMDSPSFKMLQGLKHDFGFGYDVYGNPNPLSLRKAQQLYLASQMQIQANDLRRSRQLYLERKRLAGMERVYPFGPGYGAGRRSCSGTGVFLPRVGNTTEPRKPNHGMKALEKQKQMANNSGIKANQAFTPPAMNSNDKELKLPQDWTY